MSDTAVQPMVRHRISKWGHVEGAYVGDKALIEHLSDTFHKDLKEQAADAGYMIDPERHFEMRVSNQHADLFIRDKYLALGELHVLLTEEQHVRLLIDQLDERVRALLKDISSLSTTDGNRDWVWDATLCETRQETVDEAQSRIRGDLNDERRRRNELVWQLQEIVA